MYIFNDVYSVPNYGKIDFVLNSYFLINDHANCSMVVVYNKDLQKKMLVLVPVSNY